MRAFKVPSYSFRTLTQTGVLALVIAMPPCLAADKQTGAPLELSDIETEQALPLVFLDPDGKTVRSTSIKLHWAPVTDTGPGDETTSFAIDLPPENPSAPIFTAQLWNASLASALAWQQPWQGARWKVTAVPATDGTGIDAALAVGMIVTSARRAYPEKTLVIGGLNPDGSLAAVSHLSERLTAAAAAGITRVVIPSVQRFDVDASGQVVNMVRAASDLHMDCSPAENLVEATETVMNDPLPALTPISSAPKYSNAVSNYIDDFARREQTAVTEGLKLAPTEAELGNYPPRLGAIWKGVYSDFAAGQRAYGAGQVYAAYLLFTRAHATMNGANTLAVQKRAVFDVKAALAESDDLRNRLRALMNPPGIDKGELESALLVAEMADWAYDINASLEGAQLVTKQTFSQRSDATDAEKDRAREAILFSIEQSKYLLNQADFYTGLLPLVSGNPLPVDQNAANLLPQLIPAQLASAQIFTEGIRQRANDLRVGLLFDPRLVSYVSVMRETKADWDARVRKRENAAAAAANAPNPDDATPAPSPDGTTSAPVKLNSNTTTSSVSFDPGNTFVPPHTVVVSATPTKRVSDVALCLIWVNNDCEIAALDQKYLRLNGVIDPVSHEWKVKDRAKLDSLLQSAEAGAQQGIAFAEKAEVDPSILAMIYERASYLRIENDDPAALEALRHYWRCALLGNLCWQLAHTRKAQPVDLSATPATAPVAVPATPDTTNKPQPPATATTSAPTATSTAEAANRATEALIEHKPPGSVPEKAGEPIASLPPVAPIAHDETNPASHRARPVEEETAPVAPAPVPPPAPAQAPAPTPVPRRALPVVMPPDATPAPAPPANAEPNIPTAHVAKIEDYNGNSTPPTTNAAPAQPAQPVHDNADAHGDGGAF